jgi:hypothetical protein
MPRVHFVAKARKDNPVAKRGEPYFWWKFKTGGRGGMKRYSVTRPRRSQLTQSEFLGALYDLQDDQLDNCSNADDFRQLASDIRALGEQQTEKRDAMPESLQDVGAGETLQERASGCEEWADAVDTIADNLPEEPSDLDDEAAMAEFEEEHGDSWDNILDAARAEARDACQL